MNIPPKFFVPLVKAGMDEDAYVELAKRAGCPVPPADQRIYSISFQSRGETWTATVGQKLQGTRYETSRVRRQRVERELMLSNPSTVLAIFPGYPHLVWHDYASREWENPFMAGEPTSVRYFSA